MFICDKGSKCLDCPIIDETADQCEHMTEVIKVVRCKDCKHFMRYECKPAGMKNVWCKLDGLTFGEDDYCSYGERR